MAAGAVIGAAIGLELAAPQLWIRYHSGPGYVPAPPPPPPAYPCCYQPAPPPPPMMVAAPPPPVVSPLRLGFAFSGLVQSPSSGQLAAAGVSGALQIRTSPQSLLSLEVHSLGARRDEDGVRRGDIVGLVGGRLYAWDAALAPYLDLAAGLGRATVDTREVQIHSSQLVGRVGLGLELRLGQHLALEGMVAHVRKLSLDELEGAAASRPDLIGDHEHATELRGGLSLRF